MLNVGKNAKFLLSLTAADPCTAENVMRSEDRLEDTKLINRVFCEPSFFTTNHNKENVHFSMRSRQGNAQRSCLWRGS